MPQTSREPSLLTALGYAGLHSDRLDDWAEYGPRFLGLELVERTRTALRFRMDDRSQRIVVSSEVPSQQVFGWEVADAGALEALAGRLEAAKIAVASLDRATAALRGVAGGIGFRDPMGNRLEAFWGAEAAATPFKPGRPISGFRTGVLGMGHVVMNVERFEDARWFYEDVLGFQLSDYMLEPFKAYFFHINARHHSLALIGTGKAGIHHLMMELYSLDDVGQAYDIAMLDPPTRVGTTLGRHTNDFMTSFYARSPSDFMIEYGWGGRALDVDTWQPVELTCGPSLWGHERSWLPPEQLAAARAVRAKVADAGLRAPVQVVDGNYNRMPGACPWWDAARDGRG
ncbi:MAG: VOC family protein [Hyphomicrobiaceae bacterium]|nr:VOC family protein [Hyphomicrobiaceae bacterium]